MREWNKPTVVELDVQDTQVYYPASPEKPDNKYNYDQSMFGGRS